MGASYRPRENPHKIGTTEQLSDWIIQVRSKRIKYLRNRQRNIRVQAVLTYALTQAEQELRAKQIAKINKWQEIKQKMVQRIQCNEQHESKLVKLSDSRSNPKNIWTDASYPELSSLDSFMRQLSKNYDDLLGARELLHVKILH